jgi:uncharacterized protein (TIGR00297 family)
MAHATNELLRKSLHIAIGFGAIALKWLPWHLAALVCVAAIFSNWLLLHRIFGKRVARHARGFDEGTILYPVAVLLLVLVFRDRLHYAAIAWVMLAFGDGVATLAGKWMRIAPLPWNRDKSWGGLLTCFLASAIAGIAIAYFLDYRHPIVVLIAAAAAAITESLALHVDDNLTVPFAASVALVVGGMAPDLPLLMGPHGGVPWLIANGALAISAYFLRSVSFSGAIGGWFLGALLILCAGWPMYVALLVFFVIGTAATKLGYQRKLEKGLAQEGEGRRGFSHAFSNVGVAAICAIAVSRMAQVSDLTLIIGTYLAGIASLATAAADTTATEIGQLIGRRAFLPLTLRRVPAGTEGAVSIEGTLAGLVAGLVVAAAAVAAASSSSFEYGLMRGQMGVKAVVLVTLCAFLGSYLESVAGSWNRKRISPVPNGALNFFNTAAGALLMYGAWQIAT